MTVKERISKEFTDLGLNGSEIEQILKSYVEARGQGNLAALNMDVNFFGKIALEAMWSGLYIQAVSWLTKNYNYHESLERIRAETSSQPK